MSLWTVVGIANGVAALINLVIARRNLSLARKLRPR